MNERIQQLAEQVYGTQATEQEIKFAELIVRECADFLKDTLDDHFAAEQLEEHFGVEE
jgi:hypothetical protein